MQKLRLILAGGLLAGILGLGMGLGTLGYRLFNTAPSPRWANTAAILQQVQPLAQLVSIKYVMEKVVILEDTRWYGENRVLLVAHGIVKAGVDLGKIDTADVRADAQKISLRLPAATITDAYLDDQKTQVIERTTGLLRAFDKNLEQHARRTALEDILRMARQNGILAEADERARMQLTFLLKQMGFKEIELKSR
jgi:hypothetical protein